MPKWYFRRNTSTKFQQKRLPKSISFNFESAFVPSYAGVIGHAQGLEVILNAATELQQKILFL